MGEITICQAQLDALRSLHKQAKKELLSEGRKHSATKLLRQIPAIGPLRATQLVALMQTPHRFRTKRQLWNYSGLGLGDHDSAQYCIVEGQLRRSKKPQQLRGLNDNHNHDLKNIFKGTAMEASTSAGPFRKSSVGNAPPHLRYNLAQMRIQLRRAVRSDIPVLRELIDASVRGLQNEDYTPAQMEGALNTVFGVDSQLIEDGTYLVVEAETLPGELSSISQKEPALRVDSEEAPRFAPSMIVGCGGWSKRKTLFGSDHWTAREDTLLDPSRDAAKIRAFFVHPEWARRGIGSVILDACEAAARAAGFSRYEMGATLTGAKLFSVKGYAQVKRIEIPLSNGESLPVIQMEKRAG